MNESPVSRQHHATFEGLRLQDEAGYEYWLARPLAKVLDYSEYRHFLPVVERIAQRVAQGGHNIPEEVIRRRFTSGQANLARYCALVDEWDIYDNSGPTPLLINERTS
ncbi:MAG: hypothetical protein KA173_09890 [Rhodoferax sp.]|nr:hypothetical protein [Rhodoferax sp.]